MPRYPRGRLEFLSLAILVSCAGVARAESIDGMSARYSTQLARLSELRDVIQDCDHWIHDLSIRYAQFACGPLDPDPSKTAPEASSVPVKEGVPGAERKARCAQIIHDLGAKQPERRAALKEQAVLQSQLTDYFDAVKVRDLVAKVFQKNAYGAAKARIEGEGVACGDLNGKEVSDLNALLGEAIEETIKSDPDAALGLLPKIGGTQKKCDATVKTECWRLDGQAYRYVTSSGIEVEHGCLTSNNGAFAKTVDATATTGKACLASKFGAPKAASFAAAIAGAGKPMSIRCGAYTSTGAEGRGCAQAVKSGNLIEMNPATCPAPEVSAIAFHEMLHLSAGMDNLTTANHNNGCYMYCAVYFMQMACFPAETKPAFLPGFKFSRYACKAAHGGDASACGALPELLADQPNGVNAMSCGVVGN